MRVQNNLGHWEVGLLRSRKECQDKPITRETYATVVKKVKVVGRNPERLSKKTKPKGKNTQAKAATKQKALTTATRQSKRLKVKYTYQSLDIPEPK